MLGLKLVYVSKGGHGMKGNPMRTYASHYAMHSCHVCRDDGIKWKYRWIPLTKASNATLWCFLWPAPAQTAEQNNGDASYLRRHCVHYDVTVMFAALLHRPPRRHWVCFYMGWDISPSFVRSRAGLRDLNTHCSAAEHRIFRILVPKKTLPALPTGALLFRVTENKEWKNYYN